MDMLVYPRHPVERNPVVIPLIVPGLLDGVACVKVIDGGELDTIRTNNRHMVLNLCFKRLPLRHSFHNQTNGQDFTPALVYVSQTLCHRQSRRILHPVRQMKSFGVWYSDNCARLGQVKSRPHQEDLT